LPLESIFKKIGGFNNKAVPFDDVELGMRAGRYGPIHYLSDFYVRTNDRRFRGRLLNYFWEFFTSYIRIFLFKQKGNDDYYELIR
jgi:hypothetical protein